MPKAREFISFQLDGRIALVTVNRPPVNALNRQLEDELEDVFDELAGFQEVDAVIITGGGEKDVKIRNFYQPIMERGLFYLNNSIRDIFMDELRVFPGGTRKDILDAGVLASDGVGVPMSAEDKERVQRHKARRRRYASRVTGA